MNTAWPNFFLVGAPKAGTTSLYNYLGQHPDLFIPGIKEPHFFSHEEVVGTYYDVPIIESQRDYLDLYSGRTERVRGDFSTSYLSSAIAAERIHQVQPSAHILVMLREPVSRSVSHYLMDHTAGYNSNSLMECLQADSGYAKQFRHQYINNSFYSDAISKYKNIFGIDNVMVRLHDELVNNSQELISEVIKYLGLSENIKMDDDRHYLKYKRYRNTWVKNLVHSDFYRKIRGMVPKRLRSLARMAVVDEKKPQFERERAILRELFVEDIHDLIRIHGLSVEHWLKP